MTTWSSESHTPLFSEGGSSGAGYSEIATYLRCPKEYQLQQVRGVVVPRVEEPEYFVIGSIVHAGRQRWLARNCDTGAETWSLIKADVRKVIEEAKLPVGVNVEDTGLRYVAEYVEHYSMRPKPRTIAVEYLLGPVTLFDGEDARYARTARLDDISEYSESGGRLAIGECKTTGASIADCVQEYTLHGQPLLQRILWERAEQGQAVWGPVDCVVLDVVKKGYKGKRCEFQRVVLTLTDFSMSWYRAQLHAAVVASREVKWDSQVERRITSCTRTSGGRRVPCQYRDICQFGEGAALGFRLKDGSMLHESTEGVKPWE